jgi:hypothetical protein
MHNQKIIDYIAQRRKLDAPDERIKQELLSAGWSEQEINDCLVTVAPWHKKPLSKRTILVIAVSLLVAFGAVAGYYFLAEDKEVSLEPGLIKNQEEAAGPSKQDTKNPATPGTVQGITTCDRECFEKKFAFCQKISVEEELNTQTKVRYEILGADLASGRCGVKTVFVANPLPDYVGKEMTCYYDEKIPFFNTTKSILKDPEAKCSGELYLLLSGQQTVAKKPCTLKLGGATGGYKVALQEGLGFTSTKISASGYSAKPEQVSWSVENTTVAEIYQTNRTEAYALVKPKSPGITNVVAFDGAIGRSCTASVPFEVTAK